MDRTYEQKYKQLNTKRTKASEAREKRQPFCLFCYFIQKKKNLPVDHQRWGKNRWKINYAKKDKLTLHADFVLSSARVRDEIHLHRHLPHRAVRWLTWTSTKKGNWKKSKWNSAKRDRGWGGGEMPPSYSERSGQDGETASECRETEAGTVCPPKGRNLKLRVWERLEFCPVERWYRYSGGSFHLRQNKHRVWFKFQRQLPSTVGVDRKTNIGLVGMKLKTWKTVSENKPRHNC